jgi:hypothetical protein
VGVKVGVGASRVGTEVGRSSVGVAVGPEPWVISIIGVGVGRGAGVGRGTKLPQASDVRTTTSQGISA